MARLEGADAMMGVATQAVMKEEMAVQDEYRSGFKPGLL